MTDEKVVSINKARPKAPAHVDLEDVSVTLHALVSFLDAKGMQTLVCSLDGWNVSLTKTVDAQ